MSTYAHPKVLVNTQWVADHFNDPNIKLLEAGWDASEYELGHIPGAVAGWGFADVQNAETRDIPAKSEIERMLSQAGISNDDTIVLYGGIGNLIAVMAFFLLKIYDHADVRLLDGGRQKWLAEGRELSTDTPNIQPSKYAAQKPNLNLHADKDFVFSVIKHDEHTIVDARSAEMYSGGHVPSAVNVPASPILSTDGDIQGWQTPTTHSDGTFKSVEELRALFASSGITPEQNIVTYCVRGGLSTHMWFVLTQLLGYPNVREYYSSWAEWSNLSDVPVEK